MAYSTPYYNLNYDEYMKQRQNAAYSTGVQPRTGQDFLNDSGYQAPDMTQNIPSMNQTQPQTNKFGNISSYGAVAQTAAKAATSAYDTNRTNYQSNSDQAVDNTGKAVAGAIGPWWGALADVGVSASKSVKGDSTNRTKTTAGEALDPFGQFKGDNAGDIALNFLTGKNFWDSAQGKTSKKARRDIQAKKDAIAREQGAYNQKRVDSTNYQNQMEEYNQRLNKQDRMNNLYKIPTSYQSMF